MPLADHLQKAGVTVAVLGMTAVVFGLGVLYAERKAQQCGRAADALEDADALPDDE